jgi:RND family efflux transporter MFP subunit
MRFGVAWMMNDGHIFAPRASVAINGRGGERRVLKSVLIAMCVACALCVGCRREPAFEKPAIPVRVQKVEARHPEAALRYSATLTPREQVDLTFKVGGYVESILQLPDAEGVLRDVQKGDKVTKGQVLATIRDADYLAKLNQARSALDEAEASLVQAQREFDRAERLVEADVMAKNDYDKAKEKLDLIKAKVKGAQSQVEEASIQLQDTVLKAPLDAFVTARLVERGTLAGPGVKAYILTDLSAVKAVFGVPDRIVSAVGPGHSVNVKVEAVQNREFRGRVSAVSPSADARSRVFEVEITIPNPDYLLRDGMIATVFIGDPRSGEAVPVIPMHAVVRPPGSSKGFMVYVLDESGPWPKARGREVKLGRVFANKVAVGEGLSPGEKIIVTGASLLHEGAKVSVIP